MPAGRLRFRHLLAAAAVMAFAFLAAGAGVARATVFYAHHEDAVDHPADPSRDIKTFDTVFDNATGRWVTSVVFYGPPTPATSALMYFDVGLVGGPLWRRGRTPRRPTTRSFTITTAPSSWGQRRSATEGGG